MDTPAVARFPSLHIATRASLLAAEFLQGDKVECAGENQEGTQGISCPLLLLDRSYSGRICM